MGTSRNIEVTEDDPSILLNQLRRQNTDRLINSLQNKFHAIKSLNQGKVDIFMLSETKVDDSFPLSQFEIEGYSTPFRHDRNIHGGGIIVYIGKDLPCKELKYHKLPDNIEGIFIEFILHKIKWILVGGYNPKKESSSYFLSHASKALDKFIVNYDNIILIGDLNTTLCDDTMKYFCQTYILHNLINEPTSYKNASNPSSIDVILTDRKRSFHNSLAIETSLSDS